MIFQVLGRPQPKGSLKPISRRGAATRLVEDNPRSGPWRRKMAQRFRADWIHAGENLPLNEPVEVLVRFIFTRPASSMFDLPATRETGDIDKLARNVLDALADAGVIADDSRVCSLQAEAVYDDVDEHVMVVVSRLAARHGE